MYTPEAHILKNIVIAYEKVYYASGSDRTLRTYKKCQQFYMKNVNNAKLVGEVYYIESASNKCQTAWSLIMNTHTTNKKLYVFSKIPDDEISFFSRTKSWKQSQTVQPTATLMDLLHNIPGPGVVSNPGDILLLLKLVMRVFIHANAQEPFSKVVYNSTYNCRVDYFLKFCF